MLVENTKASIAGEGAELSFAEPQEHFEPGSESFNPESFDPSEWVDEELAQEEEGDVTNDVEGIDDYEGNSMSSFPSSVLGSPPAVEAEPVFGSGSFAALGLSAELCSVLSENGISTPTRVQQRCIPPILGGADVVIGAATGSGKTYAYLLPVVMALKAAEALRDEGEPPLRIARRPRAIVVVPTRELAEQVLAVAKELSYSVKFRVIGATTGAGSSGLKKLKDLLAASPVDVLVTTTGRLLQLLDVKAIDLRFTRHIIVDEVDTMFDAGFGPELQRILRASRGRGDVVNKPQYIAAGATHPTAAETMYKVEFPDAKRLDVDLHLPPPGLDARFVRTTAEGKLQELVALLGDSKKDGHMQGGRLIIFCNTISSARFVEHFLSESGYSTASVHGEIPPERRANEFQSFKSGQVQLLVCTDIAARGLDNLDIAHVIIFDFPTSAVDYIHRAGRTARAGAEGRVTSLILKKDLALARAIERSGKEKQDALVSARLAREKEDARKAQDEQNRRLQMSSEAGLSEEDGAYPEPNPIRGSWRGGRKGGRGSPWRGSSGGSSSRRGQGGRRGGWRGGNSAQRGTWADSGVASSSNPGESNEDSFSNGRYVRGSGRGGGGANIRGRGGGSFTGRGRGRGRGRGGGGGSRWSGR